MGVASSPLWGPSSCILSTTISRIFLESDVSLLQYTQSFKWPQQIPGSKYRILDKLTQIMGVASSPLWGPRSCILSTTFDLNVCSGIGCTNFTMLSVLIMGVASSPLWGPSSCILSTTFMYIFCWNRMYQFYNMLSSFKWIHSILSKIQSGPSVFYILDQFE